MPISSRRGIENTILAGQFKEIFLSQNDIYGHHVGTLIITGVWHRFPSSTSITELLYPGEKSMGFGQGCSWAMPMMSKIEGKKAESVFGTGLRYRQGSRGPGESGWLC